MPAQMKNIDCPHLFNHLANKYSTGSVSIDVYVLIVIIRIIFVKKTREFPSLFFLNTIKE